jgi:hypothetical protein
MVGIHFTAEVHFMARTHSAAAAWRALNMGSGLPDTAGHSAASITVAQSEAIPPAASRAWEAFTAVVVSMVEAEADSTGEAGIANETSRYKNATDEMEE